MKEQSVKSHSISRSECESNYKDYLDNHHTYVHAAWDVVKKYYQPAPDGGRHRFRLSAHQYKELEHNINNHDKSKYSLYEFNGYRQYLFPIDSNSCPEKSREIFMLAWHHHIQANNYHWQYWTLPENGVVIPVPMPKLSVIHMLIDWKAKGLRWGPTTREYYESNKSNMTLHSETVTLIEKYLEVF